MDKEVDILAEWIVWGSLEDKKDLETILLKGHLLLEIILERILTRNGVNDSDTFSFYRKIGLLRNININDGEKLESIIILLTQINFLRNKLAHQVLFNIGNSDLEHWVTNVLSNFKGTKFTKYTFRTRII